MIYYINKENQLYIGDLQNGDREANNEELLNHFKQLKLQENNEKCSDYILSVYPIYKQMNIINPMSDYSTEDRTAMNKFIDSQRAKNKEYKKQILECQSQEDLDKIIIYGE